MGQRHQAFIVARVVPSRGKAAHYQCIGALHDQWCYGSHVLRAALRFLTLIKQPGNAEIIREELRGLEFAGRLLPKERHAIPCPFTQFLFLSAWGVSLDDPANPAAHSVSNLSAKMGPRDGDNNDGLTIIDVTDPQNPTCCFIASVHPEIEDLVLITAEEYVSRYAEDDDVDSPDHEDVDSPEDEDVDSPEDEDVDSPEHEDAESPEQEDAEFPQHEDVDSPEHEDLATLIRSFDDIPLMSVEVFKEAWSAWFPKGTSKTSEQSVPLKQEVASLVELTLRPAIEQAIADGKDDILDFIQMDPSRVALAKDVIRSQNPVSDGAFLLLQKLVSVDKDKCFALSGFALSGKQVVDLLALCGDSEIVSLNLSDNRCLQVGDLEEILRGAPPTIRRLVLFRTGVTDSEMVRLLDTSPQLFNHLESIIHPVFLSGFYQKNPVKFTPCFTHVMFGGDYPRQWTVSLPYFTPNTLAQGLTDFLSPIVAVGHEYDYNLDVFLSAMSAYASCSRTSEIFWGERTVAYIPRHAHDAQLGPHYDHSAKRTQKGDWKFVMIHKDPGFDFFSNSRRCYYTITRVNKAGEEFLSKDENRKKTNDDIFLCPELVDVFDIRGFFKELEREGRPSPDPKVFEKLLDLFPIDKEDKMFTFLDCEAMKKKITSPKYE